MSFLTNLFRNSDPYDEEEYYDEEDMGMNGRVGEAGALPARSVRPLEIVIMTPGSFNDARRAVDALNQGMIVFLRLGDIDKVTAARMVDFVGGAVYLLNASIRLINEDTLIMAPSMINLETDELVSMDLSSSWGRPVWQK